MRINYDNEYKAIRRMLDKQELEEPRSNGYQLHLCRWSDL